MAFDFQEFIDSQIEARPTEAEIVRRTVQALADAGDPVVRSWDREEYVDVSTEREILEQVFNLDEVYLITESGGWVFLVGGNDEDMIADYTTSLEDALANVNKWIEETFW